jgi:hypothetical protein
VVRRGNQAFLANPVPHTLNLTDFAYKRYGPATAAKGLVNAAKIATGKIGKDVVSESIEPHLDLYRYQVGKDAPQINPEKGGVFYGIGKPGEASDNYKSVFAGRTTDSYSTGPGGADLFTRKAAPQKPLILPDQVGHVGERVIDHFYGAGAGKAVRRGVGTTSSWGQVPDVGKKVLADLGMDDPYKPGPLVHFWNSPMGVDERLDAIGIRLAKKMGHDAIIARKGKLGKVDEFVDIASRDPQITKNITKSKLAQEIDELKAGGGNSQYGNIFDELGLSRIANIPGSEGAAKAVNKVIVPFERASNYAQHKVLNSTEQGLRSAALADLKKRGITGPQAMRDIHAAFGTDAPNMLTEGANMVGQPFAKFGLQSALGSAARTAAKNPQRLSAPLKLNLDFNDEVNPGSSPKYMMANPTADAAKALTNPLDYFPNHAFGPLYQAAKGFSALSQAQKGEVVKALTQAGQQFVPGGNDDIQTLIRALTGKKGSAGDSALQDVGPDIFGGYMSKAKR